MYFLYVFPDCHQYDPILLYTCLSFENIKRRVRSMSDEKQFDIQCETHIPISLDAIQKFYDTPLELCPDEQPYIYIIETDGMDNAYEAQKKFEAHIHS